MKNLFVHLRVHSNFSLAEGMLSFDYLTEFCKKNNQQKRIVYFQWFTILFQNHFIKYLEKSLCSWFVLSNRFVPDSFQNPVPYTVYIYLYTAT